ncbi:non-ribosomal peptide synthase/polyketide synthase [Rhodanobacter sp. AS-Z3]|uniref:non-ribosomal peptide synthase/polyketide synthase n=1 Tax=Rhodanobacter sp. AS-Z3 TaxID=3031330 RepID=UPI0024787912|nr:non-ribosomal peptide synthase/polyketide synthase [Rhodanobacter sp. AS-Z3]WEN15095.1 non-ribosomal peptide synthase/polyketide synthase [Rhodanobacter sp. AS-Z3]
MTDLTSPFDGLDTLAIEKLRRLAKARGVATRKTSDERIEAAPREGDLPLSFSQQRLWFLAQMDGVSVTYNVPLVLRFTGSLDATALRHALNRMLARHDGLRTVFFTREGEPHCRVMPADTAMPWHDQDLSSTAAPHDAAMAIAQREARTPFDLAEGPLIRACLLRVATHEHILLLIHHHIVSDGWSIGLITHELNTLYTAFREGRDDPLAPLEVQYPDYAIWQRRALDGDRMAAQASFWQRTLADAPTLLAIPTDRPRPPQATFEGDSVPLHFDAAITEQLKRLSREHGTTLYMTLLAAWAAVLARVSGQDDIVIGSPVANRGRREIEPLIGFFVNTLAMRIDLSGEPSIAQALARVRKATLEAQDHQDLPFEQVVELVKPERRLDQTPLFQAMFLWQANQSELADMSGLHVNYVELPSSYARFMLELDLFEHDDVIEGSLRYASALFDRDTIQRQAGYLRLMLQAMIDGTADPLARVDILGADERRLLLQTFNETVVDYPRDQCLHQLFEIQARRRPDVIAIDTGESTLTYAELNTQANLLAHHLIARGVCPDRGVAICACRGAPAIVGILATLKAGGYYIPLDTAYPAERLLRILDDAQPAVVIADPAGYEAIGSAALTARVVIQLAEPDGWSRESKTNPDHPARAMHSGQLAYALYTSGSTGVPKGVEMPHRALVNLLTWHHRQIPGREGGRIVQFTALGFDVSAQEIFAALLHGKTLVIPDEDTRRNPANFVTWLAAMAVEELYAPNLVIDAIREAAVEAGTDLPSLVVIAQAGEALECGQGLRSWIGKVSSRRLHNHYGPTETHVATAYTLPADPRDWSKEAPPIGRPIANVRTYVLDAHRQPVPRGTIGELYIGGDGVARGYLNNPSLTKERFVPDPFDGKPDARMYRTGDLVRFLADGNLAFAGRNDDQIKLRGFRIELSEIQSHLLEHSALGEAAVLVREDVPGERRLVAYVVLAGSDACADTAAITATLRAHLATRLPDYMLPAAFVVLDHLPLTANGKLDRRALPTPDENSIVRQLYEAPASDAEAMVAGLWQELLGVERVSRHDHFFELGGHSLLAARVTSRLAKAYGTALPLSLLFERPILRDFVEGVAGCQGHADELPPIPVATRDGLLELSFAQQRLWFLAQLDDVGATYHIPLALRLRGTLRLPALREALNRLFARHEGLRTVFRAHDGVPHVQLLDTSHGMPMPEHDFTAHADAETALAALLDEEVHVGFDLATGPLIRARLIRIAEDEHVFVLNQHHIVSDGWSIGIIVRELTALYNAFADSRPDPLPPLGIQYPDYAAWQRHWMTGERLREHADYWRRRLAGAPSLLALPADRPRPPEQSYAAAWVPMSVDASLVQALKRVGQRHDATLYMTVLTGWAAVLARLSGQDDLIIGTPTANRNRREIESLVGFFVNTLALRIDLSGEPRVADLLARVRDVSLGAQAHQDLPFEQVVEIAQPPRRLDLTPLFQVMFAWQNNDEGVLDFKGLHVSQQELPADLVKFDLELTLSEVNGRIEGGFSYATALFDEATIVRQRDYLVAMLEAMATDATQAVAAIDLLGATERTQLLETFNGGPAPSYATRCLHLDFEAQARDRAEAIALVCGDRQISYGALNRDANRLAHHLIALGVRPDSRVALCVERGIAMVVGLLAILKAGGGYVPLDPAYSSDRLTLILDDAAPVLLLTDAHGRAALGDAQLPECVLDLQADCDRWDSLPDSNPHVADLTAAHLAYVIYTSGSTGKPKGVMVEHAQVARLFESTRDWYGFDEHDVWCLFHSFAFDFSVWELWGALRYGGRLVVVTHDVVRSMPEFHRLVCDQGVTVLNQTPSAFKAFIEAQGQDPRSDRLRYVIFGGEALEPAMLAPWYARRGDVSPRLINMYGITETTVHVTYRPMSHADLTRSGSPIGERLPDLRLYLLDAHRQPVPLGAVGELYVGGAGVARGYLNRPELTAERFLPDPFDPRPQARLYRTGDLGRYLPDGQLLYLGRNDHQVKVRGFRIELGEIEARLAEHPSVREVAVLARQDGGTDKRLVAYVVAHTEAPADLAAVLRAHLSTRLPDYMLPAAYVALDTFPLTPNGKLDRKALPAPDGDAFARHGYEAPRGDIEITLANLWQDLLGIERVGRHDHFFELGGHSLLAVQLMERLRRLGLGTSIRALFATPVLADLATTLGSHREVVVPPNRIAADTTVLTPDLLPLIDLTQVDIDTILARVPGGLANVQDIYALAPLQEGILFHHLLAQEGDPYLQVIQLSFTDSTLLERYLGAFQRVVDRHDILRTAFVWEGLTHAAQVVLRHAPLSVERIDLDPAHGPVSEQLQRRYDPRHHRIDLGEPPLLRFVVARDKPNDRWLLLQLQHHLIDDVSSLRTLNSEVRAFLRGEGDALLPPQPFRNLIAQVRLGVTTEDHERFFRTTLGDIDEPTLPFGLSDVHLDGTRVGDVHRMLPASLNDRLRDRAKRLGVSLASLCHLAFANVVARTSGREQVVFGTVLFGRMNAGEGADRAMGLFINTLPLRVDIDDTGVEAALQRTQQSLADLLRHEHASLSLAQRCSGVAAPAPLFGALLNYRHQDGSAADEATVADSLGDITWLDAGERTNYPLTLCVEDLGDALGLTVQAVEPLDPEHLCDYMQCALENLLDALESHPLSPLRELGILPIAERRHLLETFNETKAPYPRNSSVHALFEEQVRHRADAVALVHGDIALSYAELNTRANRVAHQLIARGVCTGSFVAVLLERSIDLIVAQLAILKTGAAYVPIDPQLPEARQAWLIEDAGAPWLLAPTRHVAVTGAAKVLGMDELLLGDSLIDNPQQQVDAGDVAYVMYTSGSTGLPKGVLVPHRAINRLVRNNGYAHFGEDDRVAFAANPAFDAATLEVWAPLLNGGTLVVIDPATLLSTPAFIDTLRRTAVDTMWLTVALFNQLAEALAPVLPQLKTLIVGGDVLDPAVIARVLKGPRPQRLLNGYGPTETTTFATTYTIEGHAREAHSIPIGRPIGNTRLYLLDAHRQPVPLGAVGELYIGGDGVALGYLNRPELTAERFLPDPFAAQADARLYRTGDLARYLPDGHVVFLGRNDHQVKIRGFRIELGEIEARLAEHPSVREVAVLARQDGGTDKRLVAYVVAHTEAPADLAAVLRAHLSTRLPDYMLPAAYVALDTFPLTPNGKLDRKALPAPDGDAFAHHGFEAPRGDIEITLANLWQDLLGIERVGRHDHFFELGGHSLLAVQLMERLRRLGLGTSIRALFATPVLADLATTLGSHREVVVPPNRIAADTTVLTPDLLPLIDLTQVDIDTILARVPGGLANVQDIYALAPLQEGILFHHLLAQEGDPYLLIGQMAFADHALLERYLGAFQRVVDRHDILRTAFVWEGLTHAAQVVLRHAPLSVERIDLDPAHGPVSEQLQRRYDPRHHRIDLGEPPLLRFVVARDEPNDRWLLVQLLHHLIGDHSTFEMMLEDVRLLLDSPTVEPPPSQPFRQMVAQARLGVAPGEHERFFRDALGDINEPTLPFGLSDVHLDGTHVGECHRMLPQALNDRLRERARRLGVSLASLCHLAFAGVVARSSGREQVVFGTVLFGRMNAGEGADRTMGLFINTLPLRVNVSGTSVEDSVHEMQHSLAGLLDHEHAPLSLAQRCSGVAAPAPLFSALLNYRHNQMAFEGEASTAAAAGFEWLSLEERTSYPITLCVEDFGSALGLTAQVAKAVSAERVCDSMQRALESLLHALEETPRLPMRELDVLPPTERTQLLETFNGGPAPSYATRCLHLDFEAQARDRAEAIALVCGDRQISYGALNRDANRLAHHLIALGVRPDSRVALCVERGIAMVVGLLAILKAGGGYVPLDPAYSSDRLTLILDDAAPVLLLTDAHGRAALGDAQLPECVLDLQADCDRWDSLPDSNPHVADLTAAHLAYVIYTSGSTGKPKGVMVEHAQVARLFESTRDWYGFDEHDVWCLFHSFAFDFSVWELWGALRYGGRLVVVTHDVVRSMPEFHRLVCDQGVTVLNQTPSAFKAFIEAQGQDPRSDRLRYVIFGGEALEPAMLAPWYARRGDVSPRLINMYGITETTVHVTYRPMSHADLTRSGSPIGERLPDLRLYLLDAHRQPVPLGAVGELYVGGAGVARGYLNRPELTAERFLPDPFDPRPQARLYRTGDLGRYLPDGQLLYLGRNDHQVKVRGFRIELGEIEARLAEHPSVREVAVLARQDGGTDKRLVAYVVAHTEAPADLAAVLRAHLSTRLPDYMLPAAYVALDTFPLTPNGKLDRKALPAPDGDAFARHGYEAPRGDIEITLANLWQDLLGIERVGRHDHFFELGGHSLLAVQLMERLRRLGLGTSIRALFATPVLADLATTLGSHREVVVPPNRIAADTTVLTPDLLPLIDLTQVDIDTILARVPGGLANVQDIYALAPLQEGILFHHLLAQEGDPYLLIGQMAFADHALLERYLGAFQRVVDRHDILRTAFVWEGLTHAAQVVLRHAPLSVERIDLDPAHGPVSEQLQRRYDPRHHRIDLGEPPLLRFVVARDEPNDRWLLVQLLHHLIGDHSTMEVMLGEVSSFLDEAEPVLAPPQPFRHMVAQAQLGLTEEEHERFFRDMLGEIDEPTLPFGIGDAHRDGTRVVESHRMLPQSLNDLLREQAKRLGLSLASLCHLAWGQVVARTSGREQVVFGTVLFGRMNAGEGADRAMGLFVNTLPLRLDMDDTSVKVSAHRAQQRLAGLLDHEHASLALAQRCSHVTAPAPLFGAMLNYRHSSMPTDNTDEQKSWAGIEWLSIEERTNYPIAMSVEDIGHGLGLTAQAVEPLSAERLCGYMQRALESLSFALDHHPDLPVRALEIVTQAETTQLIETCNATARPYPHATPVHALFEERVLRHPEAIAVVDDGRSFAYAELNTRANRVAHQLIACGVCTGSFVAVLLERSIDLIVAQLAILKTGAAYVPIDPQLPEARQAWLIEDAGAPWLLAPTRHVAVTGAAKVLGMDELLLGDSLIDNPQQQVDAGDVAYVMYTSGSTGLPKGVLVPHRAINRLVSDPGHADLDGDDRMAWLGNVAFDISTLEVWAPLLHGARIVVVPRETLLRPQGLSEVLLTQRVNVLHLTAGLFAQLADQLNEAIRGLRLMLVGGDAVDTGAVARVLGAHPSLRLVHCYGPTESTTFATTCRLSIDDAHAQRLPIGQPIANTRIYLLDASGAPVPFGVPGELYIGGDGVALGYLNRPELTAESFLPDPFAAHANARMYRTGDLATYLPDGRLLFLGRNDHQLKIRGYRIEPGEIEGHLTAHPAVREALVMARTDGGNEKRLVAYLIAEGSAPANLAFSLRDHLSARLPDYMLPAAFVVLDAFPLTANGKVDRKALPAPNGDALARQAYVAPEGDTELRLAAVWQQLLPVDRVGRFDSFFALGGHSLLAMRLLGRIVQVFGVEIPLSSLFAHASLANMSALVSGNKDVITISVTATIVPASSDERRVPSFAQSRLWFLAQMDPDNANYHMPFALRMHGRLDDGALAHTLDRLFDRHEALRSVFSVDGGQPRVGFLPSGRGIGLRHIDLRGRTDAEQETQRLILDDAMAPFDLAQGPLIRAQLIVLDNDDHVFQVTQHHIVSDGWSIGVFIREFNALYAAHVRDDGDPLAPFVVQYADYAAWQRKRLSGPKLAAHHDYWRTQLADAPVLLTLPIDRARPARQSFTGAMLPVQIEPSLTKALRASCERSGTTLFMAVLAAWSVVLSRLSGQTEVVIGTPSANRQHPAIEGLIGFFVNTLALRLDLSRAHSVNEWLAAVRQTTLAAQDHQDLPFEQVVELVNPPRHLDHSPIFQAVFSWQNNEPFEITLPGLTVAPTSLGVNLVKFDIELNLGEEGDSIVGGLHYATALFDETTIERHRHYLLAALTAIAQDTDRPLQAIDLVPADERARVLEGFNANALTGSTYRCIHHLIEEQAARYPTTIAVSDATRSLDYAALNSSANRLAHLLIAQGIRANERIAICLDRGVDLAVAILATLKAGAAYVPLDPAYPAERLVHILADATPRYLLVDAAGRETLANAPTTDIRTIDMDAPSTAWAAQPADNPTSVAVTSDCLAYVIYTSGSTGKPKGVMIEHRHLVASTLARHAYYGTQRETRFLLLSSIAFDSSVAGLFGTLTEGGCVRFSARDEAQDPRAVARTIADTGITRLLCVPSLATLLIERLSAQSHLSLREIIVAGESCPASLPAALATVLPDVTLFNEYGPTEASVWATAQRCEITGTLPVPIGRAAAHARIYLLDESGLPAPLGAIGEIYIGGDGIARGYLEQPELTAERFLPDPFDARPGARMYRTGDLGRYRPDGCLVFEGRNDQQVKIRGFRIEPAEIETALRTHDDVRDALVLARGDSTGGRLLIAWVVADDSTDEGRAARLHRHLASRLPEYMIPSAFVSLIEFPLLPNGKVDRTALPDPHGAAYAHREYEAPRDGTERMLAELWSELLGINLIGRHDNFFELGGHSLLVVQLMERIRQSGMDVDISALFVARTLAALAEELVEMVEIRI